MRPFQKIGQMGFPEKPVYIFSGKYLEKKHAPLSERVGVLAEKYLRFDSSYEQQDLKGKDIVHIKWFAWKTSLKIISFVLTGFVLPIVALIIRSVHRSHVDKEFVLENTKNKYIISHSNFLDKNKLLTGTKPINPSEYAYILHAALLRDAVKSATTDEQRKQIQFLASNFLNKSAPVHVEEWKPMLSKLDSKFEKMFEEQFQTSPESETWYHRESISERMTFGKQFNQQQLVFGDETPFFSNGCSRVRTFFSFKVYSTR